MLFLGARRGDAARLGPKNMKDGVMTYVPHKTSYKRLETSIKPILPALAEAIRRTPIGPQTFLVTSFGRPCIQGGLGEWCNEAGSSECSSHGLKKAAATICANMGGDRSTAHGAVRLDLRSAGERLHAEGQQDEARS
jgi:integrase